MSLDSKLNQNLKDAGNRAVQLPQGLGHKAESGLDADPALDSVLRDFRLSVHAWSEAAYSRPRPALQSARGRAWGAVVSWTLGCVLAVGVAGGSYVELHHRQEMARIAATREAEHQRQLAEQSAREAEEELAQVDSDVAREVPHAMEPLAQLMAEDESQ